MIPNLCFEYVSTLQRYDYFPEYPRISEIIIRLCQYVFEAQASKNARGGNTQICLVFHSLIRTFAPVMVQQIEIILKPKRRGFHLVTSEIVSQLPKLPKTGIVNIFTKHTSCGLSINENCDPDVRVDMETIFNRLVPENRPEYEHTLEGADDMPAHAKSTLSGVSITIPITDGRLNLGTWQGIYFCEFRNYGGSREFVVTIIGE